MIRIPDFDNPYDDDPDEPEHLNDGEGGILECGACSRPATGYDNNEPVCDRHTAMHVYGFSQRDFL